MFSSWDAGCRHFFHLVDRVSQARTCALAGDKETLNFAKVGLGVPDTMGAISDRDWVVGFPVTWTHNARN
jgi:hypothetical protein